MKTRRIFLLLSGIVFVFLLIVSAKFIVAQTWAPPSASFPSGNTNPPLDTGPSYQEKAAGLGFSFTNAGLAIKLKAQQYITFLPSTSLYVLSDGNLVVSSPSNRFYINTQGLVLPVIKEQNKPTGVTGMVYYEKDSNLIKYYNGSEWKDVGTGTVTVTGGAAVGWSRNNTSGFIYLATSTDKVGIGTMGPVAKLQVDGSRISIVREIAGEARYHLYNQGKIAEWAFGQKSGTEHKFTLSKIVSGEGSDYVTIDASGNVGIGTNAPATKLEIFSIGTDSSADNVLRLTRSATGSIGDRTMSSDFRAGRDGALVINTLGALKLETKGLDLPKISFDGASPTGMDGRIYFDTKDKVIKLFSDIDKGWVAVGAGTGGGTLSYPLVLPGGNLATAVGGFDFTLKNNEWTGFDLAQDKKRIILGVEKGSARNVFSIEDTDWTHMMELRSDGSGFFKKNVEVGDTGQGNPQIRISDEGNSAMIQSFNGGLKINSFGNGIFFGGDKSVDVDITGALIVNSKFGGGTDTKYSYARNVEWISTAAEKVWVFSKQNQIALSEWPDDKKNARMACDGKFSDNIEECISSPYEAADGDPEFKYDLYVKISLGTNVTSIESCTAESGDTACMYRPAARVFLKQKNDVIGGSILAGKAAFGSSFDPGYRITTYGGGIKAESSGEPAGYFSNSSGNYALLTGTGKIKFGDLNCSSLAGGGKLTTDSNGDIKCADDGAVALGQKICSVIKDSSGNNWRDSIHAPSNWTANMCYTYKNFTQADFYELGCITDSGVNFGSINGGIPNPNCGWIPGESKIVFVTQDTFKSRIVTLDKDKNEVLGVEAGDMICNNIGKNSFGQGKVFKAWLSNNSTSPSTRFIKSFGKYVLPDKTIVANSWSDLIDGTLQNPINITEGGITLTNIEKVWTGTWPNGTSHGDNCVGWTSSYSSYSTITGYVGDIQGTNSWWTFYDAGYCRDTNKFHLYCFEQ